MSGEKWLLAFLKAGNILLHGGQPVNNQPIIHGEPNKRKILRDHETKNFINIF